MIIRKAVNLFILSIIPFLGYTQSQSYNIEGKIGQQHNGKVLKIHDTKHVIDSTTINNGTFIFTGNISIPTVVTIGFGLNDFDDNFNFILLNDKIKIESQDSLKKASIDGNELVKEHDRYTQNGLKDLQQDRNAIFNRLNNMEDKKLASDYFNSNFTRITNISKEIKANQLRYIDQNPNSELSLYLLNDIAKNSSRSDASNLQKLYDNLNTLIKESNNGKIIGNNIFTLSGDINLTKYIDFTSKTPDNKTLSLKEVVDNHKYTLLDFWASWCKPCREENPSVVRTFQAFNSIGFTVLSVSLDKDKASWLKAIEVDGMPWYHVSDLLFDQEPSAKLYNVKAIPRNFLIDQEGNIVAKNLIGQELYDKVSELINSDKEKNKKL